jgi:ankyrin repeat protein
VKSASENNWIPLHISVKEGKSDAVDKLLTLGANIGARDIGECTPLHLAALYGQPAIFDRLLEGGAKIDDRDDGGFTLVHLIVRALQNAISKGSISSTDKDGHKHEFWFDNNEAACGSMGKRSPAAEWVPGRAGRPGASSCRSPMTRGWIRASGKTSAATPCMC